MVQKHWPVVFASVGIMPIAAFNFAISALAFNAGSHGYGAVFLISGLAVWAAPPAAVWLAIRKWVGRTTMNSPQQQPAPPKQWDQISLTKASLCCRARACCNSASCGCNCTVRPNPDDPARRRSPCRVGLEQERRGQQAGRHAIPAVVGAVEPGEVGVPKQAATQRVQQTMEGVPAHLIRIQPATQRGPSDRIALPASSALAIS